MSRGRKKPVKLEKLRLQDECEKISRDFMPQLPNILNRLAITNPYDAIKAWSEITQFVAAKKSKDMGALPSRNITINMIEASRENTQDTEYIEIPPKKIENE